MNHDDHQAVRELPVLSPRESVWVTDQEESGEVVEELLQGLVLYRPLEEDSGGIDDT